jgi:7,8-dihydro-6-hydroxymethylpterin-pyrophosphokinase
LTLTTIRLCLIFWISFAIISSLGCGSNIKKPVIELCIVVVKDTIENSKCTCGLTNSESFTEINQVSYINAVKSVLNEPEYHPLSYCNKATALKPTEWEKLQNYLHDLENELKRKP